MHKTALASLSKFSAAACILHSNARALAQRQRGGALCAIVPYILRVVYSTVVLSNNVYLKLKTRLVNCLLTITMSYSAQYASSTPPFQARRYQPRVARVGSLSPAVPEASDVPESPPAYDQRSKRRITICVVGSGGVGKSSLTVRYLNNHFPEVSRVRIRE